MKGTIDLLEDAIDKVTFSLVANIEWEQSVKLNEKYKLCCYENDSVVIRGDDDEIQVMICEGEELEFIQL